jgi:hypothetical protein
MSDPHEPTQSFAIASAGSKVQDMEVEEYSESFHDEEDEQASVAPEECNHPDVASVALDTTEVADAEPPSGDAGASSDSKEAVASDAPIDDGSTKELPYSTRGRSTGSGSGEEKLERPNSREVGSTFEELPILSSKKEPSIGVSLLESLTEEERRTRTRIIPNVEGMHALRKSEVKEDLALARSLPTIATSKSNIQTRTTRLTGGGRKKDAMIIDGDDTQLLVQDNRTVTIELPAGDITVPSDVFVAPEGVMLGESEGIIAVKDTSKNDTIVQNPSMVESTTAFNPPRPPESVGPKKKHRVIRWERRPEDIEADMKNYRRTVQRTREELQKSEAEYQRLETIDAHLRRNFLNHLVLLNEEYRRLHDDMELEAHKLMVESELVGGSRTRSRNMTKVSIVMRDVLNSISSTSPTTDSVLRGDLHEHTLAVPGIGGLSANAFEDWDRSTDIEAMKPSISWLVPGQKVLTLYGDGVVKQVYPPELPRPSMAEVDTPDSQSVSPDYMKNAEFQKTSNRKKGHVSSKEDEEKTVILMQEQGRYISLKPARVRVRLPYGVGVLGLDAILKMESPSKYTDAQLATRWKGMAESALKVGPCIDINGMTSHLKKQIPNLAELGGCEGAMDIDDGAKTNSHGTRSSDALNLYDDNNKFLPRGASLFPTKGGRGNYLPSMSIVDVERGLQAALYDGSGALGDVS